MPNNSLNHIAQVCAQLNFSGGDKVQKLPSVPMLDRLLFEQPWLSIIVILAGGIAAWYFLSRAGQRRQGAYILGVALLLAGLNMLVATGVTTERERASALTRTAIQLVATGDDAGLAPLLRTDMIVEPFGIDRDRTLGHVATSMRGQYAIKEHRITEIRAAQDSKDAVRVQVHVIATPEQTMFPTGSWWILTWQRPAGTEDWKLSRLECQQIDAVQDLNGIRVR